MNKKVIFAVMVGFFLVTTASFAFASPGNADYFTILDETGAQVYMTGWKVQAGDQFLTADNKRYEVYSIDGNTAYANF